MPDVYTPESGNQGSLPTFELPLTPPSEVQVEYLPEAGHFFRKPRIHRRRIIPPVSEGARVDDPNPTPQLSLAALESLAVSVDDLALDKNVQLTALASKKTTSHVGEPSLATHDDVVFFTGNWYAAISLDKGATFLYVDPYHAFPDPPQMRFCCDQVVQYIPQIDTFVWLLQYTETPSGGNIQRLAFATTADVKLGHWRTFDITPASLELPGMFLDFPDLAVGTNMLYMTTNAFKGSTWKATVLVRIPLSGIQSGAITAQHTSTNTNFNFRVAQHCGTRAFWASHQSTSSLRLFSWDETAAAPTFRDVTVASWADGPYSSKTPDGFNWLGRADRRIVGATQAGNELWFAWGANRGGANARPQPYVQIARIDATTFQVIDNINLWDPQSAIFYGALATNSNSEVGVSYTIGGGGLFPSHVVGILTGTRKEQVAVAGVRGPAGGKWGDYMTVRRHSPNDKLFASAGFTLQAGSGLTDATPDFILFGRSGDV